MHNTAIVMYDLQQQQPTFPKVIMNFQFYFLTWNLNLCQSQKKNQTKHLTILKNPFHPVKKSCWSFLMASACRYLKMCWKQQKIQ